MMIRVQGAPLRSGHIWLLEGSKAGGGGVRVLGDLLVIRCSGTRCSPA